PLGLRCVSFGFDHTDSLPYAPAFSCRLVPPTPVIYGSLAGESTPSIPSPQSYAPESPDAAKNVIPWEAPCLKIVSSVCSSAPPEYFSQSPQLILTMCGAFTLS